MKPPPFFFPGCRLVSYLLLGLGLGSVHLWAQKPAPPPDQTFPQARRVLFLGDSITAAGHYITLVEAHQRLAHPEREVEIINLGLPSETCSGLSEPDHPFPRPNVHERLDRALAKIQPDLVVACYGMNDGIYHPFSKERFAAYQAGIRTLVNKVRATGAKVILLSPPPFDPLPQRRQNKLRPAGSKQFAWFAIYENYDREVLQRYRDWILTLGEEAAMVIDLRQPVLDHVEAERKRDPDYALSGDGVHLNETGHRLLAGAILKAWGGDLERVDRAPEGFLELAGQRQQILHDAWLSHVGHERPGMKPGLPLEEARARAGELAARMTDLIR